MPLKTPSINQNRSQQKFQKNHQSQGQGGGTKTLDINPNKDGVDHINIYSNDKTELGRFLSNFTYSPFVHPQFGSFNSIEGFWWWLSTGKKYDEFRILHGLKARNRGRELPRVPYEQFEETIKRAIQLKIETKPDIRLKLALNKLPFKHYYVFNDSGKVVVRPVPNVYWQVKFIEDLAVGYRNTKVNVKLPLAASPVASTIPEVKSNAVPDITDYFAKSEMQRINEIL